jgi:hypothetical protein
MKKLTAFDAAVSTLIQHEEGLKMSSDSFMMGNVLVDKKYILDLLATDDEAVARALVVLTDRQTQSEQSSQQTEVSNGIGFNPYHAAIGTSMAKFYQKYGRLSPKQVAYWRRPTKTGIPKIGMYWRQLIDASREKYEKAKIQVSA